MISDRVGLRNRWTHPRQHAQYQLPLWLICEQDSSDEVRNAALQGWYCCQHIVIASGLRPKHFNAHLAHIGDYRATMQHTCTHLRNLAARLVLVHPIDIIILGNASYTFLRPPCPY